ANNGGNQRDHTTKCGGREAESVPQRQPSVTRQADRRRIECPPSESGTTGFKAHRRSRGRATMNPYIVDRRAFLKQTTAAFAATATLAPRDAFAQQAPNSSGTGAATLKAPANACDCHMHVYDAERFPPVRPGSRLQTNATVSDYRLVPQRTGTTRTVVVTPAVYVTDNRVTVDAVAQLGDEARGVAVLHPTVTDAELKSLDAGGVRGIRFTQFDPNTATTTIDMIEPLAKR